jgi:hypothetical protein
MVGFPYSMANNRRNPHYPHMVEGYLMSQITAALITAAISAVSAIASAIISYLNRRAIQAQTPPPVKTGDPGL